MTNITAQTGIYAARKTFRAIGTDKAIAWLDQIMAAVAGTTSGESALIVLNRKLESAGVLSTGTSDPIFANETALFFYNTSNKTFFIRSTATYEALIAEEDIIEAGTTTPVPNANTAWIVLRTDTPKRFFLKERSGSPGSYTYSLQGPFFSGSYQLRIILSAQDTPATPSISWNWENANFNISGGDWSVNTPNAKWWRIVECPNNTNTTRMTPLTRIGDPTASDILYTRPNRDGNLPASVNSVQELGDAFHDYDPPTTTTTTTTSGNDEIQIGEFTSGWTYSNPLTGLSADTYTGYHAFTLNSNLRSLVTTYGTALSIATSAAFTTQAGSIGSITLAFGIADNSNNFLFSNNLTIESNNARTTGHVKVFGNLPSDFSVGRLLAQVVSTSGTPANVPAFFDSVKFRIEPDEDASSVPVDRTQFGDVLPSDDSDLKTSQDVFEFIDDLPLQVADTYDLTFEGPPNGIDDNGEWVVHRLPLERFLRIRNERPQQTFIAKIQYNSAYISGSRGSPPPETVNFSHRVWSNLPSTISNSQLEARSYLSNQNITNQNSTAVQRNIEVTIPNDCTEMAIGFKSDSGQDDARLNITNYDFDIELGIDSSGFDGNLTDNIRSNQSLAQAVDDLTISGGGASTATNVSVDNTQFGDPARLPGGIAENTGITGVPVNPTNMQEFSEKVDTLFQLDDNPFISNQALDWGGSFAESGTVNSGTVLLSNPIDIPQELRDLGVDVTIRMRIRINAITSNFRGNFRLVNTANTSTYGDSETANGGGVGARAVGSFVTFQRTIISSQVPNTFRLRYTRTSSAGSATINRSVAYMLDRTTDTVGNTGQSANRTTVIIWRAGATLTSRLTEPSETTLHTLLGSNTWGAYDDLEFHFDTSGSQEIGTPVRAEASWFAGLNQTGMPYFTDDDAVLITPVGTNQFRFRWNPLRGVGLRDILGINYD